MSPEDNPQNNIPPDNESWELYEKKDWRIGLSCKIKYRHDERYYEGTGTILDAFPSGHGGIIDKDGVLKIKQNGKTFLDKADNWVTT